MGACPNFHRFEPIYKEYTQYKGILQNQDNASNWKLGDKDVLVKKICDLSYKCRFNDKNECKRGLHPKHSEFTKIIYL